MSRRRDECFAFMFCFPATAEQQRQTVEQVASCVPGMFAEWDGHSICYMEMRDLQGTRFTAVVDLHTKIIKVVPLSSAELRNLPPVELHKLMQKRCLSLRSEAT